MESARGGVQAIGGSSLGTQRIMGRASWQVTGSRESGWVISKASPEEMAQRACEILEGMRST